MVITNTTGNDIAIENVRLHVSRVVIPANGTYETTIERFWPLFFSASFLALVVAATLTVASSAAGDILDADTAFNTGLRAVFGDVSMSLFNVT